MADTDTEQADRRIMLEAVMKLLPADHYPIDAYMAIASRPFEADPMSDTYYTIVVTPMAPHVMRGFFEVSEEVAAERFGW